MGRTTLVLRVSLLLAAVAGSQAVRWLLSPVDLGPRSGDRPAATAPPSPGATTPARRPGSSSSAERIDPNLPLYRGQTRRLAAQAIDDTALAPMNQALIGLARRSLGLAYSAFPLDQGEPERLLLDLQHVDELRFVENLLALVNSRQVSTRTEAVDRFSDHVRQLRYSGALVSSCRRHHDFSRWAQAAQQQGYLVNLSPFLPGASSRQRRLRLPSSPAAAAAPNQQATSRDCITTLAKSQPVKQAYVPLQGLSEVLPSLRSGDIVALVSQRPGLDVSDVGLVEVEGNQISAIHAAAGSGVMRSPDLARYAKASPGVIGLAFYRPVPNPDGRPDR